MTIEARFRHRLGAFDLDAGFESGGRLTALFGPSGSGKTSLVNMIGGLIRPGHGRLEIDGRVLSDSARGIFVPMHRRRIGIVFQDARLFPHMSVSRNLRFGRWFTPAGERYADMDRIVDMLGLGALLDRWPASLSGGERQRVAIGRALISSPRLILMDEPLASLDDSRKAEIMPYIERLRDEMKIPIIYVSHSVAEVARLATDMVVMADGRVAASGPTSEILQRLDLLTEAERGEGGAILEMIVGSGPDAYGMTLLGSPAGEIRVTGLDAPPGTAVRVRIRARDVIVATERPRALSALNILAGLISDIKEAEGPLADMSITCGGQVIVARITRKSRHDLALEIGTPVFAVIKSVSLDHPYSTRGTPALVEGL